VRTSAEACEESKAVTLSATATTRTMIMLTLTGKTALVTGASRGMGRATALALAAAGAQVLVHSRRLAAVQQARLRRGIPLVVRQIHPTQRSHRSGSRGAVRACPQPSRQPALRARPRSGGGRLRYRPWPLLGIGPAAPWSFQRSRNIRRAGAAQRPAGVRCRYRRGISSPSSRFLSSLG
jgi:hypothetical protein